MSRWRYRLYKLYRWRYLIEFGVFNCWAMPFAVVIATNPNPPSVIWVGFAGVAMSFIVHIAFREIWK